MQKHSQSDFVACPVIRMNTASTFESFLKKIGEPFLWSDQRMVFVNSTSPGMA